MSNPVPVERENAVPESAERRNFVSISAYQVLLRMGWIFKTESVIVPAALDSIGGSGWVRGCLPMLNRVGQSFPPLLAWPLVQAAKRQQRWLAFTTALMGVLFCLLACVWLTGFYQAGRMAQLAFLFIYALFFVAVGINQLTVSVLIGKLIRANLRGRLMLTVNIFGCIVSISCAWFILRHWLGDGDASFGAIFGMAGILFIIAAVSSFMIEEATVVTDHEEKKPYRVGKIFGEVWQTYTQDHQFRRLAIISSLFGLSMTLMPHYQNLARVRLDLGFSSLLPWLIIQNLGVAVFSVPIGSVADRLGNRMALRMVLVFLLAAPVIALISSGIPSIGGAGFLVVYFLLGLMPVTMRVLSNYSLEFAATQDQPRYLAAQSLAMALPVIATSALIGFLLDRFGYEVVFGFVIFCLLLAWMLTFRVHEPRHSSERTDSIAPPPPTAN